MWIGADPGGRNNFGLAFLDVNGTAFCQTVSSASQAADAIDFTPNGVGIDAPLWWSAGIGGGRYADCWLRRTYGIPSGTVQTANSLRGAALAQGMMLVDLLRRRHEDLNVTEAHPKALLFAMHDNDANNLFKAYDVCAKPANEHERDAVIAAICAREGFSGRWKHDLASKRATDEQDPQTFWLRPVHYWWPT
jgi:predicted nuclease with RNAse H fold